MRVLRVHFRAGMAGQFLPEFLRDACIRHCRDETMPETMKAYLLPDPSLLPGRLENFLSTSDTVFSAGSTLKQI